MERPRLVIGGTGSGCGKTSVAVAVAAAFRRRGLSVQTFKAGPDFLDPAWLAAASGRPCYNLDGWMCGEDYVRGLLLRAGGDCDLVLIEGVMGLFDGASSTSIEGSTAELARWLDSPVLLVVNAHGAARSVAAAVAGFAGFEPGVRIGGVIANSCGSERHAGWVSDALRGAGQAPLMGALPRGAFPSLSSRHLGLAAPPPGAALDAFARAAEQHLQLDAILALAHAVPPLVLPEARDPDAQEGPARVGVAQDAAFHFYYPDNLAALETAGATLVRFSPLTNERLPAGLDGLYLGGGYPEEHAAALSANRAMREDVRVFAASGRPVYAECGGLMYLSQGIETTGGERHPMAGVLPVWTRMLTRRKALGYVEATAENDSLFAAAGQTLRGHEFHYSELIPAAGAGADWRPAYRLARRREEARAPEGFQRGRVLASYAHLHFASHPGAASRFVRACREEHP
jgi:cobyrinic acid a,c-diamide synthase